MMRSLWTAGSGMMAQQFNVDVISNNLANVNTLGYKKQRAEFKDLLYATLDRAYMLDGSGKPVNLQAGHGVKVVSTANSFLTGNFQKTDNPLDMAIDGDAFFRIKGPKGDEVYTRDGSFKIAVTPDGKKLVTSDGSSVLDDTGNEILLNFDVTKLKISDTGEITYTDETGASVDTGQKMGLVKFPNRQGLESIGNNYFSKTTASGDPVNDAEEGSISVIQQSFLESSNVQVVEEMVNLIIAQRAYEVNSKAIQSSDEMLGIANNLRR